MSHIISVPDPQLPGMAAPQPAILPVDPLVRQQQRLQIQAGSQNLQSGALDLQEKQRDLNDQTIFASAMKDAAGDPDKAFMLAAQRGASGKGLMALKQTMLKNQETQSVIGKNTGEGASATATAEEKRNEILAGETGALLALPPAQRPGAYPAARQRMIDQDHVDANTLPLDYEGFGGDAKLLYYHNQFLTAKGQAEEAKAQLDLMDCAAKAGREADLAKPTLDKAKADAQLAGTNATEGATKLLAQQAATAATPDDYNALVDAAPHGIAKNMPSSDKVFDSNGKMTPAGTALVNRAGMTSEQRTTAGQSAATLEETKLRDAQIEADRQVSQRQRDQEIRATQQRVAREQKQFDITYGAGLDGNGHPLSPDEAKAVAQRDPTAVAIANYQMPPPSSRTSALGIAQMKKVLAIDPTYDGTKFAERNKITQDYSASGTTGKQITSTDTALAHLGNVSEAGKALKSGNVQALNRLANAVGAQVGQSAQTTYDSIVETVAPEISKAVIGGVGGVEDRQKMKDSLSSKLSDSQREGAIGGIANLLGARYHKQAQAYESDMGKPLSRNLSPESQAMLNKYSGAAGGGSTPKVGDVVTVGGRKVVVTSVGADGKLTGKPAN